jgi:hypothetical protein
LFVCLSCSNLLNHGTPRLMVLVSLESLQWVHVHPGDFIIFRPIMQKLLNIEQIFHWNFDKLKTNVFTEIGEHFWYLLKNPMTRKTFMEIILSFRDAFCVGDIEFCATFVIENSLNRKNWFWNKKFVEQWVETCANNIGHTNRRCFVCFICLSRWEPPNHSISSHYYWKCLMSMGALSWFHNVLIYGWRSHWILNDFSLKFYLNQ